MESHTFFTSRPTCPPFTHTLLFICVFLYPDKSFYPFISLTKTKLCKCKDFLHPTTIFPITDLTNWFLHSCKMGKITEMFKDCTQNIRETGTYNWNQKYQRHLKVHFEFNILSIQPQWPHGCLENPRPYVTQMLSLNFFYNVNVCVFILYMYMFIFITTISMSGGYSHRLVLPQSDKTLEIELNENLWKHQGNKRYKQFKFNFLPWNGFVPHLNWIVVGHMFHTVLTKCCVWVIQDGWSTLRKDATSLCMHNTAILVVQN